MKTITRVLFLTLILGAFSLEAYDDFDSLLAQVCDVKQSLSPRHPNRREEETLALQVDLGRGCTAPEISQDIRWQALKYYEAWKDTYEYWIPREVDRAMRKAIFYGIRPVGGYVDHYFERDLLKRSDPETLAQLRVEFHDAIEDFWPLVTRILEKYWWRGIPEYSSVRSKTRDEEMALDVYTSLIAHQLLGWVQSGFGGLDGAWERVRVRLPKGCFKRLNPPNRNTRADWLQELYEEASYIEHKWFWRFNDRNYTSPGASCMTPMELEEYQLDCRRLSQALQHLPSDIRPELIVLGSAQYSRDLAQRIEAIRAFSPETLSLDEIIHRLLNHDLLPELQRFSGLHLDRPLFDQVKQLVMRLGMKPQMFAEKIGIFTRSQAPEIPALHLARQVEASSQLKNMIQSQLGQDCEKLPAETILAWVRSRAMGNWLKEAGYGPEAVICQLVRREVPLEVPVPEIEQSSDLYQLTRWIDNLVLQNSNDYGYEILHSVRDKLMHIGFHPGTLSIPTPSKLPPIKDHIRNISRWETFCEDLLRRADTALKVSTPVTHRLTDNRLRFIKECWPTMEPSVLPGIPNWEGCGTMPFEKAIGSIRSLLSDGRLSFLHLQGLEVDVERRNRKGFHTHAEILQDILKRMEQHHGFKGPVNTISQSVTPDQWFSILSKGHLFHDLSHLGEPHGVESHRIQWNLIMREMERMPESFGETTKAVEIFSWLGDEDATYYLGYPHGKREALWRDLFDFPGMANFSTTDCITRIIRDYCPALSGMDEWEKGH